MTVSHSLTGVSDLTNQSRGITWKCVLLLEVANASEVAQEPSWKEEGLLLMVNRLFVPTWLHVGT